MALAQEANALPERYGAVEDGEDRPRAHGHVPLRGALCYKRAEGGALPVPAVLQPEGPRVPGPRAARSRTPAGRCAGRSRGRSCGSRSRSSRRSRSPRSRGKRACRRRSCASSTRTATSTTRSSTRDRDAVIERARAAGVELHPDARRRRWRTAGCALALAERHAGVLAAAGVHPHDAAAATDADLDALEELAQHPRVAVVGEIGLDFYRNLSPRDRQIDVLRRQLETARRVGQAGRRARARGARRDAADADSVVARDGRAPAGRAAARRHALLQRRCRAGAALHRTGLPDLDPHVGHAPEGGAAADVARAIAARASRDRDGQPVRRAAARIAASATSRRTSSKRRRRSPS